MLSPVFGLKHPEGTLSKSKPRSKIHNPQVSLLRLRFLTLFMSHFLPNFSRTVERHLVIVEIREIKTSSALYERISSWLNVLILGGKGLKFVHRGMPVALTV
jgi:hypothetical protein